MAKGQKHAKRLKSEKAKIKLKGKKSVNQLPKGLNITDTSFKVKKILLREQLKHRDETEILSTRKLNIKDLLARLKHHNSTARQEALKQLKEIISGNLSKILHSQLSPLLRGLAALSLDKEKDIRRDSLNALNLVLGPITNEQLIPFREILISYLSCAMTHIDPRIKEDSLLFVDVLAQNCTSILVKNSYQILPNFLGMISSLHNDKPGRQLTTLNFRNTSVKWRIKVLERLAIIFSSIINYEKLHTINIHSNTFSTTNIRTKEYSKYVPIYNNNNLTRTCEIDFDKESISIASTSCTEEIIRVQKFIKYISALMPLVFDIWLEVCPEERSQNYEETPISNDAATLLKIIVEIIKSIIGYIDLLDHDDDTEHIKHWFRDTYHNVYMKNFLSKFPYTKQFINQSKKRQEDFCQMESTSECLEQNLGLAQIHVWFMSIGKVQDRQISKSTKDYCISITEYLNDTIKSWYVKQPSVLPQLAKLLRTLFLKASIVWYKNGINLDDTLELIIQVSFRLPKKEFQSHLSLIVGDIILEYKLNELYREKIFEKFVKLLPSLLLRSDIEDRMIRMISQIVLRFRKWIQEELVINHKAIIENAKKINIIGSNNDQQSRLMIHNLFYFMDTQIYY